MIIIVYEKSVNLERMINQKENRIKNLKKIQNFTLPEGINSLVNT